GRGGRSARTAVRLVDHSAGPAHPRHRSLRVIAELLRGPPGGATATELAQGARDRLPDLRGRFSQGYGTSRALARSLSVRPQETIRVGWIRMCGSGRSTASARPRISTPRGRHGASTSSMTIAARPVRATSRNFLVAAKLYPVMRIVLAS